MTDIIVYRNPLEKLIWDGLVSAKFIPVLFGVIVFFLVFLVTYKILEEYVPYMRKLYSKPTICTYVSLTLGTVAGISTIYLTWV